MTDDGDDLPRGPVIVAASHQRLTLETKYTMDMSQLAHDAHVQAAREDARARISAARAQYQWPTLFAALMLVAVVALQLWALSWLVPLILAQPMDKWLKALALLGAIGVIGGAPLSSRGIMKTLIEKSLKAGN